jgi:protocatechuate 3,4-dioxygenase beta subunit
VTRGLLVLALLCPAALLTAQQAPPRDTRGTTAKGTAELAGVVRTSDPDAHPLSYAQVGVIGTDNGVIRVTSADADGRFRLQELGAGKYIVAAFKAPYIGMVFGATQPGRPGTAVAIAEGERRDDLVIALVRGAIISGAVTDDQGRPASGLPVMLQSPAGGSMYQQMMSLAFTPAQVTDDRGMFRFAGVMPGEYLVTVNRTDRRDPEARTISEDEMQAALRELAQPPPAPPPPASAPTASSSRPGTVISTISERPIGNLETMTGPASASMMAAMFMPGASGPGAYAPVFYPGTVNPAEAQPVRVAAGDERHGLDFVARAVLTAQLSGTVTSPDGSPVASVTLNIRQADSSGSIALALMSLMRQTRVNKDGTFTVNSVPPGRYTIEARTGNPQAALLGNMLGAPAPAQGSQPPLFASLDVVVQPGESQTGLDLRLQPAARVTGSVHFNVTGSQKPKDASQVMVSLVPAVLNDPFFGAMGSGAGRAAADGTFAIEGVAPGRYVVQATSMDPAHLLQFMPQEITIAGRNVTDLPIEIRSDGLRDVRVTLTDVRQEIAGRLEDASGRPATAYSILLFSTDRAHWLPNSRRVLLARPATDGSFTFSGPMGPPPGDYYLAALTDLGQEDQYKPSVLGEIAASALKLTLAPGEKKRQDIRIAR